MSAKPRRGSGAVTIARWSRFGDVAFLMTNAGVGRGGSAIENPDGWRRVLETNLYGVLNGVQAFAQGMIDAGKPAAIVNTGSKQGSTCPPGDTAYNVSKAGIKVAGPRALAHNSAQHRRPARSAPTCWCRGSTFTGHDRAARRGKPAGALVALRGGQTSCWSGWAAGDFYILCPDNERHPRDGQTPA